MNVSALCYLLGYLTGIGAFALMARRRRMLTQGMVAVMSAGLIGALVSANIMQALTGSPGKTVLGGAAGGYVAVILYKRWIGITRPTGDLFAVAWCAGEAVGRWGCYFGGCCYGSACSLPWAVWQHGTWRHPSQIYMSLAAAAILVILLAFERMRPPENALFFLQGALYCTARFGIEFVREGPRGPAGLSLAQWGSAVGAAFFVFKLVQLIQRPSRAPDALLRTGAATVE